MVSFTYSFGQRHLSLNGMVTPGPSPFQHSVTLSAPRFAFLLPSASRWECARTCPAKRPLLSALRAHTASGLCHLDLHLHCSLGRHGRTSTPGTSVIPLWDPWHTQQWSRIPVSKKEICSCPFRQSSDGAENQVEQDLTKTFHNQPL